MIKKIQVVVREVYESEEVDIVVANKKSGEKISDYDYRHLPEEEKENFTFNEFPNGKSKIEVSEGDPIFGQIFQDDDLNVKDLILFLNRTK